MRDITVNVLVVTTFVFTIVLLSVEDGLGMAIFELAAHVLFIRMRDGLGMYDFF